MSAIELDAPRGFVPMREYLRLQRRIEELEARLAEERDLLPRYTANLNQLRARFGLSPHAALMVMALMAAQPGARLRRERIVSLIGSKCEDPHYVAVLTCKVNRTIAANGGPERFVSCERGGHNANGYWISTADKQWLRDAAPEAFTEDKP